PARRRPPGRRRPPARHPRSSGAPSRCRSSFRWAAPPPPSPSPRSSASAYRSRRYAPPPPSSRLRRRSSVLALDLRPPPTSSTPSPSSSSYELTPFSKQPNTNFSFQYSVEPHRLDGADTEGSTPLAQASRAQIYVRATVAKHERHERHEPHVAARRTSA